MTSMPRWISRPGVSRSTRIIDCWLWRSAVVSVLPITMRILAFGFMAPLIHHLRPLRTYSSPSRSIRVEMLVASEEATAGSVMAKAERISAFSSGSSHCFFCTSVPNMCSTSMLPVSGAAQLSAAGARCMERPVISARGAYWRLVRPPPSSPGRKKFHRPRLRASARSSASTGTESQAHLSSSCSICSWKTGSAGWTCWSMKSSKSARSSSVLASNSKSISTPSLR